MKKTLLAIACLVALVFTTRAQSTVTGQITGENDETLPGVTILEKGTSNGAVSDIDGNYRISVSSGDAILVISYLGYRSEEVAVGSRSVVNVNMTLDVETLDEVVVTAYGIERQADAVGYSTAAIEADEFAEAKQISLVQSLAGKVAGVNITAPPTGPGGSTNILIRGMRSFNGDNRPLIVIDGVPVSNQIFGPAGKWGGRDNGDGLTSLNPDDIERIDILKGAAAGTLYGTEAQNGVLLITTKKGTARKGVGIDFTSNFMADNIAIFPEYQDQYGQGINGAAPTSVEEARTLSSWGSRLDGSNVIQFDGVSRPYTALDRKDNLKNYYETGHTFTNTLALTGGNEVATARLSISHLDHSGVVPNTEFERLSLNLLSSINFSKKVVAEIKANYVREDALNRPNLSDNPSNPGKALGQLPANVDIAAMRNVRDENGNAVQVFNTPFTLNPFWGPFENINSDVRDRYIGYFKLGYNITDWLTIQGRVSLDYSNQRLDNLEEIGTAHNVNGAVWNDSRTGRTESHDILLIGKNQFAEDFTVDYTLGINQFNQRTETFSASGNQLVLRDRPNISNARNRNPANYDFSEQRRNAILANANFGYKGFIYLDLAGRREWLSTLTNPLDLDGSDNSISFGSVSTSFVFTDAFALPSVISYGKLRASYGTAGGGTDPYRTSFNYGLEGAAFGGYSNGSISGSLFPNPNIKPNLTVSREIGLNMSFFDDRLGFDLTLYQTNTTRQIVEASVSTTSAWERILINSGEIENKGVELLLNAKPIATGDLTWDVTLNLARNTNEVISVSDELDQLQVGDNSRFADVSVRHIVGESPAALYGRRVLRDANGNIVHNDAGLPMSTDEQFILGNFNPDLIAGLTNTISYKDFSFSFLIDTKQGAQISSLTKFFALFRGLDPETLVGRENADFTIVGEGVNESGGTNEVAADLAAYYGNLAFIGEKTIVDASYIKLREVRFSYNLPRSIVGNTPFSSVTLGVVGRNLLFLQNDVGDLGIDPEGLYNNTNATGLEYLSIPSTRSFGFNVNLKF